MKKKIAIALAVLMACGTVSSCSNGSSSSKSAASNAAAVQTLNYYVPGTTPPDLDKVTTLINAAMAKDNVGVAVKFTYIPFASWDQKINLMLSTGANNFDMFEVMNDRTSLSNYAARGALADITDSMKQFGQNIIKNDTDSAMKSGQVDGKQYAIPAQWVESAFNPQIMIRKDIMKEYGITSTPTNFKELTDDYLTVMKNWKGNQKPYLPVNASNSYSFGPEAKTMSAWPFTIYNKMFYVNQDGTIQDFFETAVFKQECEDARIWYTDGLINPDVMSETSEQMNNQLNSGDWFVHFGTIGNIKPLQANYPNLTPDDFDLIDFAPSKPDVRAYGTRNMNAVPKQSKNPEAAVKMINWIYADQANYDLFIYGRDGIDYTPSAAGQPKGRTDIINKATSMPLYNCADWMIGNLNFIRPATGAPTLVNQKLYTQDKNSIDGIAADFAFDAKPVQTKFTDVKTAMAAVICPMANGSVDYDKAYPDALKKLKSAGIDDVIAEYNKQFKASQSSK